MVKYFLMVFLLSFTLFATPEFNQIPEEIPHYRGRVVSVDQEKNIITITLLESGKTVKIAPEAGVMVTFYGKKGKKQIATTNIIPKNEIAVSSSQLHKDLLKKSVDVEKIYTADYLQMD